MDPGLPGPEIAVVAVLVCWQDRGLVPPDLSVALAHWVGDLPVDYGGFDCLLVDQTVRAGHGIGRLVHGYVPLVHERQDHGIVVGRIQDNIHVDQDPVGLDVVNDLVLPVAHSIARAPKSGMLKQ